MFTVGFPNSAPTDPDHVLLKVGSEFLHCSPSGHPELVRTLQQATDQHRYLFSLHTQHVHGSGDSTDGSSTCVWPVTITAASYGHQHYLCARFNTSIQPPAYDVCFDDSGDDSSVWLRTQPSSRDFILESKAFRGYFLTNDGGRLCLERKRGRRNNEVSVFPVCRDLWNTEAESISSVSAEATASFSTSNESHFAYASYSYSCSYTTQAELDTEELVS